MPYSTDLMGAGPYNSLLLLGEKQPHPLTHMHPSSLSSVDPLCESGIRGNMSLVIPWQHLQCAIVSVKINWQEITSREVESWESWTCEPSRDEIRMLVTNIADVITPNSSQTQHCPK